MPSRRLSALATAAAFALLLGACGDDDDAEPSAATETTAADGAEGDGDGGGDGADAGVDEFVAAIVAEATEDELEVIGEERSECIARALAAAVTVERLNEGDISPEEFAGPEFSFEDEGLELDDAQRQQLETDFAACGSAIDLFVDFLQNAGAEVGPEQETCVREAVTEEQAVTYFVNGLLGQEPDPELETALRGCFPDV
jgi:hypothetical protein